MIITENAIQAILETMQKSGLDPQIYSLHFCIPDKSSGGMAFNFVKNEIGKHIQFGDLKVITAYDVEAEGLVIDLQEIDGRTGLIFTGEEHVSQSN